MRRKCSASPSGSFEGFQGSGMTSSMRSVVHGVHGPGRKSMKRGLAAIVAPGRQIDSGRKPHRSTELQESNMTAKATLVLGGTGKTGRRIVEQLAARKVPVRVGSR